MFKQLSKPVDTELAILCFVILCLNMFDVFATLRHIEYGAEEVNPLMSALMHMGPIYFFVVKFVWVAFAISLFMLHPNPTRVRFFAWMLSVGFVALTMWHAVVFYYVRG